MTPTAPTPPPEDPLAPVPTGVDSAHYRQVMGHFATGVTVVTAAVDDEPAGLAVNSFTSVSLDPPLVAICISRLSTTWPKISATRRFCVNILADDQEDICRIFAARRPDKFKGIGWKPSESGAPILDDILAWIDCRVLAEHDGGDHVLILGEAVDLGVEREGLPLVFYRGGYGHFQP